MAKTLEEILNEEGFITALQLQEAKDKQFGAKKPLQELFVEMGFITEEKLAEILSRIYKTPFVNLDEEEIDQKAVELLSYKVPKQFGVFPVRMVEDKLILAMSNPLDIVAMDEVRKITNTRWIEPVLATKNQIAKYINRYYQLDDSLYDILKNINEKPNVKFEQKAQTDLKKQPVDESKVIIELVDHILTDAIKMRASDIHLEPQEKSVCVRYRIDGYLRNIMQIETEIFQRLVVRVKVLAELDITNNRKPQDGRTSIQLGERKIDLRVSTIPTFYGEKIVLRILDPQEAITKLDKIGLNEEELKIFEETVKSPQGMILVVGPTGSGKTSTLYAVLHLIKSETKNIITIEDPIEYLVEGVNQMQVNPRSGITFADGLRSILRQDPDIILVGEIRDKETADIASKSSLTGHLVFTTLHTNDAISSITRLLDIGIESYIIASSMLLVVAQRLVRLICPDCKEEYSPVQQLLNQFGTYIQKLSLKKFYRGRGCPRCNYTGFLGRTGIFEILRVNENIKKLISDKSGESAILEEVRKNGFRPLVESGIIKVVQEITTLEEVARVCVVGDEAKPSENSPKVSAKQKILIVDDEEHILKMLETRLISAGYEVMKAKDGKEAVELAVREKPDLIITDIMMPVMDGYEATKTLRSKLETAIIPIMMLTAKSDVESEIKGIDYGADDYMAKPFDGKRLLARVELLLRRNKGK